MSEELRLRAVKQFERLNLKYNQELQQTVSFAAKLCQTPVSAISLIDKNTQWIKVKKGLDIEEIPRELTFCTHTIKRNQLLLISDTQQDGRFCGHPLVTGGLKIKFYAGAPLVTKDGHRIGTLCVLDSKPHVLSSQQKLILKILAKHAISIMELQLSVDQLATSFTALKQIREHKSKNEVKLRAMFESLTDAYFLLGKEGEITDFNQAAYDFVKEKFELKLVYGYQMTDFLTPVYQPVFTFNYRKALAGEKGQLERLADYGAKGKIWWDCVFTPVRGDTGEIIGVSYVARNINERKLFEEKIMEQNRLLIKIAEIQSHDYRGPLASIMGLMGLIEGDGYVASREYLMMMQSAVNRLDDKIHEVVNLVNDPKSGL